MLEPILALGLDFSPDFWCDCSTLERQVVEVCAYSNPQTTVIVVDKRQLDAHLCPVGSVPVCVTVEEETGQDDFDQIAQRGAYFGHQRAVAEELSAQRARVANGFVLQFGNA